MGFLPVVKRITFQAGRTGNTEGGLSRKIKLRPSEPPGWLRGANPNFYSPSFSTSLSTGISQQVMLTYFFPLLLKGLKPTMSSIAPFLLAFGLKTASTAIPIPTSSMLTSVR